MPVNILGGLAGAGGGFATGGPIGAALAGLGGLLGGGGPRMSAAQQAALKQQRAIANNLFQYGTSTPMTNQEDLNNLAQSLGLLGQQQRSQLGGLAAGMNVMTPTGGMPDLIGGLMAQNQAQRMNVNEQHLRDAVAARRQALLQAANVNQQAFDMASARPAIPQNQFGVDMAQLAKVWAQKQAYDQAQKNREGTTDTTPTTTPPMATASQAIAAGQAGPAPGFNPIISTMNQPYDPFAMLAGGTPAFGAGDAPQSAAPQPEAPPHDVMKAVLELLTLITKTHMALQKPKKKKKSKGAGDAPAMALPGLGAMAGPPMLQPLPGGNRMQGAASPGNEPGGLNGTANQMRQPASAMLDRLRMGASGLTFPY